MILNLDSDPLSSVRNDWVNTNTNAGSDVSKKSKNLEEALKTLSIDSGGDASSTRKF